MRRLAPIVFCLLTVLMLAAPSRAWHDKGHKVTAMIAFRSMDPAARDRVVSLLRKHVAFTKGDWPARVEAGSDPDASLFLFASVFPDDARKPEPYHDFHVPDAHFIDLPFVPDRRDRRDATIRIEDPYAPLNLVKAFRGHLATIKSASSSDADKALAVSWLFHLTGDIHQPLHSVTMYNQKLKAGDRGGNSIRFAPALATATKQANLHAYWDGLPGEDSQFANVEAKANELMLGLPASGLDVSSDAVEEWMTESFGFARSTVYAGLADAGGTIDAFPSGYEDAAKKVADRRVAQAGYRLARLLEDLFGTP